MRHLTALMLSLLAGAMGAASAADIYCNNQGRDCSDRPTPGSVAVHVSNSGTSNNAFGTATPAADKSPSTAPADNAANDRLAQEAARRAVQKDVGAARADQCKQAQEKYQKSIEARRIYRTGKDGEREYLSDAEADQMRMNARLEVTQTCGKAPTDNPAPG